MSRRYATLSGQQQKRPAAGSTSGRASAKLQSHHLDRLAIVYVRQSSPQQVVDHKESTARQYALVDLAAELGWAPDRIEVIDEDQGQTASTAQGRHGFHRLLAEVGLDHVGIILGIELSRLARSNKDWAQLIELCGIFRTLLADHDGQHRGKIGEDIARASPILVQCDCNMSSPHSEAEQRISNVKPIPPQCFVARFES